MASVAVSHVIHNCSLDCMMMPVRNPPMISTRFTNIGARNRGMRFVLRSKKSDFQDFQGYAKPARLLPASEVKEYTDASLEKLVTSFSADKLECLYKLTIQTSHYYGSGLTDLNSGILICLVDENGDSILQRIASSSSTDHPVQSQDNVASDVLHFQRGAIDEFTFEGPIMGKIEALWIGLESGQWRPRGLSIICRSRSLLERNSTNQCSIFQYDFMAEDILLGEGNDVSMVELRPSLVNKLSGDDLTLSQDISPSTSLWSTSNLSNEESMKEYADLKFSLLLYDALLIIAGSTIASFSAGENAAFAFLTGGIGGFLYLLLLQRSIDGLPSPVLNTTGDLGKMFGRFKDQVLTLVLALTFAVIVVKLVSGDDSLVLTPKDIMLGMMGFLSSKVAVVLAAFKPLPAASKEGRW